MSFEVLSEEELQNITGMKRYSAQATWFKENFRVDPVRRPDGSIVPDDESAALPVRCTLTELREDLDKLASSLMDLVSEARHG